MAKIYIFVTQILIVDRMGGKVMFFLFLLTYWLQKSSQKRF